VGGPCTQKGACKRGPHRNSEGTWPIARKVE
jgi:hypothetical protein